MPRLFLILHLVCDVVDSVHGDNARGVDGDSIGCSLGLVQFCIAGRHGRLLWMGLNSTLQWEEPQAKRLEGLSGLMMAGTVLALLLRVFRPCVRFVALCVAGAGCPFAMGWTRGTDGASTGPFCPDSTLGL